MTASVRIDQSRLQRLLTAVGGPGERLLLRKAERVADLARQYAAGHGSIPEGIQVHNGSRRHPIRPRRTGGWLRFEVGGRVVYARQVNHPGYRGDPFLTRALRNAR